MCSPAAVTAGLSTGEQAAAAGATPNADSGFRAGSLRALRITWATGMATSTRPTTTATAMKPKVLRRSAWACARRISSTLARRSLVCVATAALVSCRCGASVGRPGCTTCDAVGTFPRRVGQTARMPSRCWRPQGPLDLRGTLAPLWRRAGDPAFRVTPDGAIWRALGTPDGPATVRLAEGDGAVVASAWGPGAGWALAGVPELLGARDDPGGWRPGTLLLRDLARRHAGLRIPRTRAVWEALVPAVLEQRVTGADARRSWRDLLRRYGEPAPGPAPPGMRVCPGPDVLAAVPSWEWHRLGVDPRRAATVRRAALVARRLEETVELPGAEADRRLRTVCGIGAWTAAVARMLALLAPYAGHRHGVVRVLERAGIREPRFGPRIATVDFRGF